MTERQTIQRGDMSGGFPMDRPPTPNVLTLPPPIDQTHPSVIDKAKDAAASALSSTAHVVKDAGDALKEKLGKEPRAKKAQRLKSYATKVKTPLDHTPSTPPDTSLADLRDKFIHMQEYMINLEARVTEKDEKIRNLEETNRVLIKKTLDKDSLTPEEEALFNTSLNQSPPNVPLLPPHDASGALPNPLSWNERLSEAQKKAIEAIQKEKEDNKYHTQGKFRGTYAPILGAVSGSVMARTALSGLGVSSTPILGGLTAGVASLAKSEINKMNGETPEERLKGYSNDKGWRKIGRGLERSQLMHTLNVFGESHEINAVFKHQQEDGTFKFPEWDLANQKERKRKIETSQRVLVSMLWFDYMSNEVQTNGTIINDNEKTKIQKRHELVTKAREAFITQYIPDSQKEEVFKDLDAKLLAHRKQLLTYTTLGLAGASAIKGMIGAEAAGLVADNLNTFLHNNNLRWPWESSSLPLRAPAAPVQEVNLPPVKAPEPPPVPSVPVVPPSPTVPVAPTSVPQEVFVLDKPDMPLMQIDPAARVFQGGVSSITGAAKAEAFMRSASTFTIQTDHGTEVIKSTNFDPFNGDHMKAWDNWHNADTYRRDLEIKFAAQEMKRKYAGQWVGDYLFHKDLHALNPQSSDTPFYKFPKITDLEYENNVRIPSLQAA